MLEIQYPNTFNLIHKTIHKNIFNIHTNHSYRCSKHTYKHTGEIKIKLRVQQSLLCFLFFYNIMFRTSNRPE